MTVLQSGLARFTLQKVRRELEELADTRLLCPLTDAQRERYRRLCHLEQELLAAGVGHLG